MKHPPKTVVVDWLNTIWETDLPYQSKYLACYLRKFMNSQHDMAYPSYARIIHETGLSRMTVSRYLERLEQEGWIARNRGHKGKNTEYTACFPASITERLVSEGVSTSITESKTSIREVHELNNNKQSINNIYITFDKFWSIYPKKVGKADAEKRWNRAKITDDIFNLIANHLSIAYLTTEKKFIPNPSTYINQQRWNDEVITNDQKNRPNGNPGGHRLSAVERVRATNEANRAARANNRDNLGNPDGHLRECAGEPVRGSDAGSLDIVIEGDYTITDQGRAE